MNFIIKTGLTDQYLQISDQEYHYSFGYYSNNSWVDDHRIVMSRFKAEDLTAIQMHSESVNPVPIQLVLVDLDARQETILTEPLCMSYSDYVVHGTTLYYVEAAEKLYKMNVETGETTLVYHGEGINFPHMTSDGKHLNWHHDTPEDQPNAGMRINLETGEVVKMFERKFSPPFTVSNHMMICPTDPNLLFFAHEGNTFYVSNRLWLAPLGKEPFNIAKQYLNANGDLGDCFGHECWAADGKGMYFVKYPCSPEPPRGLCYVPLDKPNESKVLYSKYNYWHVSVAPDGRHLAADTQDNGFSGVCLVDMETGKEEMLVKTKTNWRHPCHPHPHFNPSCTKLAFHELDENGQIVVGFFDI